ncbi:MAG: Wzz/FepE/Etk N-terminal domain-containing protein [Parvibaculaceae bacterium]
MNTTHPGELPGARERPASGGIIDARDIMRGIWRRKYMVLLLTLLAGASAFFFVRTAEREYSAHAQVLLESLETPYDRSQQTTNERRQFDERDIASQVQVLRSRDLAKRVIGDLQLEKLPEFDPLSKGLSQLKRVMILLGLREDPRKQTPEQRALTAFSQKVKAYQVAESRVIEIEGTSRDPQTAADVANSLAEVYVVSTREAQSDTTARAREWLSEQIETLRKKVIESEDAVESFRTQSGLLKGPTATLSSQELGELNTQITLAESAKSEAQAKVKAIRDVLTSTGAVDSSSAVLSSPLIQRLREQQVLVRRNVAELSATYLDNHPRLIAAKRELDDLNRQIRSEALKVVAGLEQEAKIAAGREASLRESLASLKTRVGESNVDEVKLRALEREATANRNLLESFLDKFSDASARQEVLAQPGIARIISRADPPTEPSFPKSVPIILLASLGGFTIGLGLAFMAEVMKGGSGAPYPAQGDFGREALRRRRALRTVDRPFPVPPMMRWPDTTIPQAEPRMPLFRPQPLKEVAAPQAEFDADAVRAVMEPPADEAVAEEVVEEPYEAAPTAPVEETVAEEEAPETRIQPAAEPSPPPPRAKTAAEPSPVPPRTEPAAAQPMPSLCIVPRTAAYGDAASVAAHMDGPFVSSLKPLISWCTSLRQTLGVRRLALVAGDDVGVDGAAAVLALARLLAAQESKVVLVDAAAESEWIGRIVGKAARPGLRDLLAGRAKFGDVIVKDPASEVHLLGAGAEGADLTDTMTSSRMDKVLAALGKAYDVVLVHVGRPLSDAGERETVAKCHAGVVFAGTRHSGHTAALLSELGDMGLSAVQVVRFAEANGASSARAPEKMVVGD